MTRTIRRALALIALVVAIAGSSGSALADRYCIEVVLPPVMDAGSEWNTGRPVCVELP